MPAPPPKLHNRVRGDSAPRPDPPAASSLMQPAPWFFQWATGDRDGTGVVYVNEFTALNYAALYTCVTLIAGTVAALPCKVFRRRKDGGQDEVTDHPAVDLMAREFNPNTSAMIGREAELGHLLTWGNSFTQIVRSKAGDLLQLQPIGPDVMSVRINRGGALEYVVRDTDTGTDLPPLKREEVCHVPYYTFDSLVGMSTVQVAKGLIRQGIGQDRQAERFVTKGLRSPGAIRFPQGTKFKTPAEAMQFRERFRTVHNTATGDQEIIVLEDGAEWQALGTNPEAAQLLQSRRFSRGEIMGLYHVPPHLGGDVEKTTSWGTGIEELNIGFVVYCLLPILRRIEQERDRKFFRREREADKGLFVEHVLAGLLRGDSLKQAQTIQLYINLGVIMVNEARRMLGFNPVANGDVRYFPLNMGRIDGDGDDVAPPTAPQPAGRPPTEKPAGAPGQPANAAPDVPDATDSRRLADGLRRAITAAVTRCLRKESAEAVRAAKKPAEFGAWVTAFYAKHAEMVAENVGGLLDDWHAAFAVAGPNTYAADHCARSRADLLTASECRPDELADRVERCVERWQTERIASIITELAHAPA